MPGNALTHLTPINEEPNINPEFKKYDRLFDDLSGELPPSHLIIKMGFEN